MLPHMAVWGGLASAPHLARAPLWHGGPGGLLGWLRGKAALRGDVTSKAWPHTAVDILQLLPPFFFSFFFSSF